jgi:uncharacterized membrane protein YjjB (DUF3815 family)
MTMNTLKNIWLVLIAVVLVAFANVALKVRVMASGEGGASSWFSYILSLALDPWVWAAVVAAAVGGLLYVIISAATRT